MKLFGRATRSSRTVVIALDDTNVAEHTRQLADFVEQHAGAGHELFSVRRSERQQIVVCRCGMQSDAASADPRPALIEDELIDDG